MNYIAIYMSSIQQIRRSLIINYDIEENERIVKNVNYYTNKEY